MNSFWKFCPLKGASCECHPRKFRPLKGASCECHPRKFRTTETPGWVRFSERTGFCLINCAVRPLPKGMTCRANYYDPTRAWFTLFVSGCRPCFAKSFTQTRMVWTRFQNTIKLQAGLKIQWDVQGNQPMISKGQTQGVDSVASETSQVPSVGDFGMPLVVSLCGLWYILP